MQNRYEDWPIRLQNLLDEAREQEFDWGRHDCCQWAGRVIETLTGTNPIAHLRGRYRTPLGSRRVMKRQYGTTDLHEALTQVLGQPVSGLLAQRGDIVTALRDGVTVVGVVDLSGEKIAAVGWYGLEYIPLTAATAAWKVQ